ncbi:hypothetical protein RCL1_000495 [Eukaryota sp. TZLM3-RCL]
MVSWWESAILCGTYVVYIAFMMMYDRYVSTVGGEKYAKHTDLTLDLLEEDDNEQEVVLSLGYEEIKKTGPTSLKKGQEDEETVDIGHEEPGLLGRAIDLLLIPVNFFLHLTVPDCSKEESKKWFWLAIPMCLAWLCVVEFAIVEVVTYFGCFCGLTPEFMGIALLGPLTSLPEALNSSLMVRKGLCNAAIGNALGANVFAILCGLGIPWLLKSLIFGEPIYITDDSLMVNSFVVLLVAIIIVVSFFLTSFKLTAKLGYFFYACYVGYLIFATIFSATADTG